MAMSNVGEFGPCACSGTIQLRWVEARFVDASGDALVVGQVPQGYCGTCNSSYYKASILQALEQAFAKQRGETKASAL